MIAARETAAQARSRHVPESPIEKNSEPRDESGIELAHASLVLWADDGTLDAQELDTLLNIALRDGVITDSEKDVLRGVFNRLHEEDVSAEVWNKIQDIRKQHAI